MPIPNPTVWCHRMRSASGRTFEVRISRGQYYKYGVDNPGDVIIVDNMDFPKDHWGDTGVEEFDEDGDLVPVSFNFGIHDQFTFSGTINGVATGIQDLRASNTSLCPWIFNDLSRDSRGRFTTKYYIWKSWLNSDGTLNEIYYSGRIDLSKITGVPFYREKALTDSALVLETKKYQSATISDDLAELYVQDLVESLTQSDMATTSRKPWYCGYVFSEKGTVKYPGDRYNDILEHPSVHGDAFQGRLGIDYDNQRGYLMAYYPFDQNTDLNPNNGNVVFNDRMNVYGVKHGFQGISYTAIVNKIASLANFTFDLTNSDKPLKVYAPIYSYAGNTDHIALSPIGDDYLPSVLCRNYNVLFGVRPDDPLVSQNGGVDPDGSGGSDYTRNGRFDYRSVTASGSSPVIFALDSAPDIPLHVGQNIYYFDFSSTTGDVADGLNDNVYIHSVIDSTHFTLEFGEGVSGHSSGDIINSGTAVGTGKFEWASQEWYDSFQTPGTLNRNDTLLTLLVAITNRFYCIMEWDISQSGANIGKPVLIWRDILDCSTAAPTKWTNPETSPKIIQGSETQNMTLSKVAVKLTNKGDLTAVYCPRKPRIGEAVIEKEIMSRLKKWGEYNGYTKSNFINNRDKDVISQLDTFYKIVTGPRRLEFSDTGYIIGMNDYYYFDGSSHFYNAHYDTIYPRVVGTEASGWYVQCYEEYHGSTSALDFADVNKDYYNTLVNHSIVLANALLLNKTMSIEIIRGITDDSGSTRKLLRRLKMHWRDEFGNTGYKRTSKLFLNEFTENCTVHFIGAKADDTILTPLPYIIDDGTPGGGAGIGGGSKVGTGGGTTLTTPDDPIEKTTTNSTGSPQVDLLTSFPTIANITYKIKLVVIGRRTGGSGSGATGDSITFEVIGDFKNVAGTLTRVGSDGDEVPVPNSDDTGLDVQFDINSTNLDVNSTTPPHTNFDWIIYPKIYSR